MSKRFPPKYKAEALRLLSKGVSLRSAQAQLAKKFGVPVSSGGLRKWQAEAAAPPPVEDEADELTPAPPAPPAADAPALPPGPSAEAPRDVYEHTRQQLQAAIDRATAAAADGNHAAAARFNGDIVKYTLLLARLDKDRRGDTDSVSVPRAELERAKQSMRDRVTALASDLARTGGITCSNCGRALRIALAKGE